MFNRHFKKSLKVFCIFSLLYALFNLLCLIRNLLFTTNETDPVARSERYRLYKSLIDYVTSEQVILDLELFFANIYTKSLKILQEFDKSGNFIVVRNVDKFFRPQKPTAPEDNEITLVSQCSINKIHYVTNLTYFWDGPMSLSVFVTQDSFYIAFELMEALMQCHSSITQNVFLHLVIPYNGISIIFPKPSSISGISCADMRIVAQKTKLSPNYEWEKMEYPNNLLRNVGLSSCKSGFVFVIDVDMYPSRGLYDQFQHMIKAKPLQRQQKFAYVVPVFESVVQRAVENKSDLLDLVDKNLLRQFYIHLCDKCQDPTNYKKWMNLDDHTTLDGAYEVSWRPFWEPFYILPWNSPKYDERFKQYGFNRISHSCEVYLSGYRFIVLNEAFLIHDGFKMNQTFYDNKQIDEGKNKIKFNLFLGLMRQKYTESFMKCK